MRIVHVVTGLETGGAEMMLYKLLAELSGGEVESAVVSLMDRGTIGPRIEALGIALHTLAMRRGRPSSRALWRLAALLRAARPDLVQGWMYHGNLAALLGARTGLRPAVPVVWNIRQSPSARSRVKPLTRLVIRTGALLSGRKGVARVVYNSRASALQHEQLGYAPGKTTIIPNGFDTGQFRPDAEARRRIRAQLGLDDRCLLVGLVARWHPQKDHGTFLAAARGMCHFSPEVRFVLAGPGIEQGNAELAGLIRRNGLDGRVHLLGDFADTPALNAALDLACSASSFGEGFPNVLGEAMACGVPCVTTDVGDSAWIVGQAGRVVPPNQPGLFAGACRDILALAPAERARLGDGGRLRVRTEFEITGVAQQYVSLYRSLLEVSRER